jgi:hypothetical protein
VLRGRQHRSTCSDGCSPSIPITPQCRQGLLELELSENVEQDKGRYRKRKTEKTNRRMEGRLVGEKYKKEAMK